MEEKYNFEKKKIVINNLIKKKLNKYCVLKKYEKLCVQTESEFCLFCESVVNNKNELYCCLICKEIYENNLINFKNDENVKFPSFEMLTNSSKKKYKNFIQSINEKKYKYDKVIIMYEYKKAVKDFNVFKEILSNFILIKDYEKIFSEKINFNIIIFKTLIENINDISFKNLPNDINNEICKKCLYCKETDLKQQLFYILPKNYVLGIFCSEFCLNVFISINEQYIKQPYKFFFILPHFYYFKSKSLILSLKEIFNNKKNCKKITTYNINYISNIFFEIIETIY